MAAPKTVIKNLGKSLAYSSLEVMKPLVPNTTEFIRSAKSGVDVTKEFISKNMAKLQQTAARQDRSAVSKKAHKFIEDALNDIKKGNLSLGDLMDDDYMNSLEDEFGDYSYDEDTESSEDSPTAETKPIIINEKATVEGLKTVASVLGNTQVKTAQYQTTLLSNTILSGVASLTDQMRHMDDRLVSINNNLVELVRFNNESQAVTNQAMLRYFDQHIEFLKREEQRRSDMDRRRRNISRSRNPIEGFMSSGYFDFDAYKKIVKDNMDSSVFGQVAAMAGLLNPDMLKMMLGGGVGGRMQPQKLLLEGLMNFMIPNSVKRSIRTADSYINTYVKNVLSELGAARYTDTGIKGFLGSIFGIDTRRQRSLNFGQYERGEIGWDKEAKKALVQIIPKQLSEIKAAILNREAEYYDAQTGRFLKRSETIERARRMYDQSINAPLVNLFNNEFSTNINDVRNKAIWDQLTKEEKQLINILTNEAVENVDGFSKDISNSVMSVLEEATERMKDQFGATAADAQRMVMTLNQAVNEARDNVARTIREFQSEGSAFAQVAMDEANLYGILNEKDLKRILGANPIDLIGANSGAYTISGKKLESMSEEDRQLYENQRQMLRGTKDYFKGMKNSKNKVISTFGKIAERIYESKQGVTPRGRRAAERVDKLSYRLYQLVNDYYPNRSGASNPAMDSALAKLAEEMGEDTGSTPGGPGPASSTTSLRRARVRRRGGPSAGPGAASSSMSRRRITLRNLTDQAADAGGYVSLYNNLEDTPETPMSSSAAPAAGANRSYLESLKGDTPDDRTADATESTEEIMEGAYGKQGFMTKVFDSKFFKNIRKWLDSSSAGKIVSGKIKDAGDFIKKIFTEDYVDENGNKTRSVIGNIQDKVSSVADAISETVTGDKDPEKGKEKIKRSSQSIIKSLTDAVRKHAPRIITGGLVGGALGLAASGSTGLLGGLFLPGGPIGGAVAGMGLSILSNTETFKKILFGDKDEETGERSGGLIKKDLVDKFKKALPALGIGAAAGIVGKLLVGNTLGGKVVGFLPSLLTGNGLFGAAMIGSAAGLVLSNENFRKILFGEKQEDGKRQGSILSGMYNKFTEKLSKLKEGKGNEALKRGLIGAGAGIITGATLGQFGLLGSALTFGGPIGAAVAGSAIGIASASDKFNNFLFGTKGDKEKGIDAEDGLLGRARNFIDSHFIEPTTDYFKHTASEFAWWAKDKIEVPFRMAFGPIVDAFNQAKESVVEAGKSAVDSVAQGVKKTIEKILNPVGNFFMKHVLSPLGKVAGGILKAGLYGAGSLVAAPLNLLSMAVSPLRRKEERGIRDYLRGQKASILEGKSFGQRLAYNASMIPGIGRFIYSDVKDQARREYVDTEEYTYKHDKNGNRIQAEIDGILQWDDDGNPIWETDSSMKNAFGWMTAKQDRREYKKNRKTQAQINREERQIQKLRTRWRDRDNNNRGATRRLTDKELSDRLATLQKKYGIVFEGDTDHQRDELFEFMWNYDEWSKKRYGAKEEEPEKEGPPKPGENPVVDAVNETSDKQTGILTNILDVLKAMFDVQTGRHYDTDNITNGESLSNEVDEEVAGEINDAQTAATANAVGEATEKAYTNVMDRAAAEREREEERNRITGNTSGNATNRNEWESEDAPKEAAQPGESFISKIMNALGSGGFNLSSLLKIAGIAAGAFFLFNEDFRNTVTKLIGGAASTLWNGLTGANGGAHGERALEVDEEGNVTQSVTNISGVSSLMNYAKTAVASVGPSSLKTTATILDQVIPFKGVRHGIAKLGSKIGSAASSAFTKVTSKFGQTVATETAEAAASSAAKTAAKEAAESAGGYVSMYAAEAAGKEAAESAAKKGAETVAKTASKSADNLLTKALGIIKSALEKVMNTKAGQNASKLIGRMTTFIDDILKKLSKTSIAKYTTKLMTALGFCGAKTATNFSPLIVVNAVLAGAAAILGAIDAKRLFEVNAEDVDWKMRLINAIYEGACNLTGVGAVISVINEITTALIGFDFVKELAYVLYDILSSDEESEALREANAAFEQEVKNYNEANGTNLSSAAYNDLKNKGVLGNLWNNFLGLFGKGDQTDYSVYEVENYDAYKASQQQNSQSTSSGYGARTAQRRSSTLKSRNAIGYGASQYDPRWSNMPIGIMPNGQISTMATGGCGPTAVANAFNALQGYGLSPSAVGSFAANNGYITDGGANAGLFDNGVDAFGMRSSHVNSGSGIINSLKSGHPVILSGKSSGYGTPYTDIGHVVTATGMDRNGNVIVQDPRSHFPTSHSISEITNGMTNAWSMRKNVGYGYDDEVLGKTKGSNTTESNTDQAQTALANKMRSIAGQIEYDLYGPNDPDKGSASCASTVAWAYRHVLGVKGMSASSSAQSKDSRFVDIVRLGQPGAQPGKTFDTSVLKPGDIVYMYNKWNGGGSNHTEMYVGDGYDYSHGGPDKGPQKRALDAERQKRVFAVRRYKSFTDGSEVKILDDGTSSGISTDGTTSSGDNILTKLANAIQNSSIIQGISSLVGAATSAGNKLLYTLTGGLLGSSDAGSAVGGIFNSGSGTGINLGEEANITVGNQAQSIWDYLIRQGYTKEAASGIMGCWQNESGNRSDIIEGYYLDGYPGFQKVLSSNSELNKFTQNVLFPAYKRSNISISEKGYLGTDGNYYPGIGLAQWTGPRGQKLLNWTQQSGLDWREQNAQLKYFEDEIAQRGIKDALNAASTPEEGAHLALDKYEMYDGYGNSAPSALKDRTTAARTIYNKFAKGTSSSTEEDESVGYGSSLNFMNQFRSARGNIGFGQTTGNLAVRTDNTGVETRLDRLITILESIDSKTSMSSATKVPASNSVNISYGDTKVEATTKPVVVTPNANKRSKDSNSNSILRQKHLQIAAGKHA